MATLAQLCALLPTRRLGTLLQRRQIIVYFVHSSCRSSPKAVVYPQNKLGVSGPNLGMEIGIDRHQLPRAFYSVGVSTIQRESTREKTAEVF